MSLGRRLIEIAPRVPWRVNFHLRSWLGEYPDFVIAGFPKCGTTSLYNYLIQHPDVLHGDGKEQWYFSTFPLDSSEWYRFRFPFKLDRFLSRAGLRSPFLLGDGTPDYIYREASIQAMYELVPNAKIIVLMRDPIDRSYSYFKHETRAKRITQTFEELVSYEHEVFKEKGVLYHEDLYEHPQLKDTFLLGSLYSIYLEKLYDYYSKDNVLLLSSETLFSEPGKIFGQVTEFLHLDPCRRINFKRYNSGNYSIDQIPCHEFLQEFYQPYNDVLKSEYNLNAEWLYRR